MASFLTLKEFVAAQLGKSDGATYNAKRETLINRARSKFYGERPWSFLLKTATVTLASSTGSLPTDYNLKFDPVAVYHYDGANKYTYEKVRPEDLASFGADRYVYALVPETSSLSINQDRSSVTLDYTHLPADRPANTTEDSSAELAPDITAIGYLAIAMWWLSSERSTAKYQLFTDLYKEELGRMVQVDGVREPFREFKPGRATIQHGYIGR